MQTLLKNNRNILNTSWEKCSFKEICNMLDEQHNRFLLWEMKTYSIEEVWKNIQTRNNTFLTSKLWRLFIKKD